MSRIRVALLAGGWSGEREVSLKSGGAVGKALDREKYEVISLDPRDDLLTLIEKRDSIDVAFVLLHGRFGEDGRIQGLLDILGIPYVGSGVLSSAMALNKKVAKERFKSGGLAVAQDMVVERDRPFSPEAVLQALGPKTVVKPVSEGSSLGASVCHGREQLLEGIERAFRYDDEVIVESFMAGQEVTCCVMGTRKLETLPLVEIVPQEGYPFFDYEAKYTTGATREICPAPLPEAVAEKVKTCAKKAHRLLKCGVWSRTDMILCGEAVFVLETNTIPGMTENSLFPLAAKAAGLPLDRLVDRLITLSLEERGRVKPVVA